MVAVAIVVNKGKHKSLKIEVKAGWAPSTTSLPTPAVTTQGYSDRLLENEPSVPGAGLRRGSSPEDVFAVYGTYHF